MKRKSNNSGREEKAIELYMKNEFAIGKAADFAVIHVAEFYELMKSKGIESNLTIEDFEESLRNAELLKSRSTK